MEVCLARDSCETHGFLSVEIFTLVTFDNVNWGTQQNWLNALFASAQDFKHLLHILCVRDRYWCCSYTEVEIAEGLAFCKSTWNIPCWFMNEVYNFSYWRKTEYEPCLMFCYLIVWSTLLLSRSLLCLFSDVLVSVPCEGEKTCVCVCVCVYLFVCMCVCLLVWIEDTKYSF